MSLAAICHRVRAEPRDRRGATNWRAPIKGRKAMGSETYPNGLPGRDTPWASISSRAVKLANRRARLDEMLGEQDAD